MSSLSAAMPAVLLPHCLQNRNTGGRAHADAYVYNDGRQTVAASAPILFSSNGVLSDGMTHPVNGNAVTIENAGTYAVWFTMMGTADAQFALFLNDTSVAGTIFGTSPGAAGSAVRSITGGFAIVEAPANSTLALVNFTGATVTLATGVGGAGPNVNASKKDGASEKRSACLFMLLSRFFPFSAFV